MKKIILIIVLIVLISCSTSNVVKNSQEICKTFDHLDYSLSIPDPFTKYCNSVFVASRSYVREVFDYTVACKDNNCLTVEVERFCQDDRGSYIAVKVEDAGPEMVFIYIHQDYLKQFQSEKRI